MGMYLDLGGIFFIIIVDFKVFGKHVLSCGKGSLQFFLHTGPQFLTELHIGAASFYLIINQHSNFCNICNNSFTLFFP